MSKLTIHIDEAQTQLRDLLERAARGEEVTIESDDQHTFRLILVDAPRVADAEPSRPRVFGTHRGQFWISDDFDDELPDEFWLGNEKDDPLYW